MAALAVVRLGAFHPLVAFVVDSIGRRERPLLPAYLEAEKVAGQVDVRKSENDSFAHLRHTVDVKSCHVGEVLKLAE